jgi:hypothetical protein
VAPSIHSAVRRAPATLTFTRRAPDGRPPIDGVKSLVTPVTQGVTEVKRRWARITVWPGRRHKTRNPFLGHYDDAIERGG